MHLRQRAYDWLTKNVRVNVVTESNCPHSVLNPLRWVLKTCGYVRWMKNIARANAMFRTRWEETSIRNRIEISVDEKELLVTHKHKHINLPQDIHVSAKTVPFHRRQIQPLEGSNCIIMGRLALVRTLSSMRSSRRLTVDACSMMDCGVVKTICRAVGEFNGEDRNDRVEGTPLGFWCTFFRCERCLDHDFGCIGFVNFVGVVL